MGSCATTWLWENERWADFKLSVFAADSDPNADPLETIMLHAMIVSVASPGHFRGHCERTQNQAMGSASGPAGAEGSKRRAPLSAPVAQNLATERSMAEATGLEAAAKRASADAREDGPLQPHGAAADRQDSTADGPVQLHIHVQPVFLNISIQPTMPAYEYRLTLFPGEPEGVPKAVLRHLYTGALPDDPEQLIWMLQRADYLDLADTMHAVLQKLISLGSKKLTLQHAAQLGRLPDMQCSARQAGRAPTQQPAAAASGKTAAGALAPAPAPASAKTAAGQLQELIDSLLLAHLPSAPAIVTDAALLAQFNQLPLALLKRWLKLDEYEVDSGNTLAVLFTAWHDAQPEPPTEQQCRQLSDMLPLAAVSVSFHTQALRHMKWWRSRLVWGKDALESQVLSVQCGIPGWEGVAGGRSLAQRLTKTKKHTWRVTGAELQQLGQTKYISLPTFYFAGYQIGATVTLQHFIGDAAGTGPLKVSLGTSGAWPGPLAKCSLTHKPADAIMSTFCVVNPVTGEKSSGSLTWWWVGSGCPLFPIVQIASVGSLGPTATLSIECSVTVKS